MLRWKNRKMDEKRKGVLLATIIMIFVVIAVGPMDCFSHGYFGDTLTYEQIPPKGFVGEVSLEEQGVEIVFSPSKSHFAGFEINLSTNPEGNMGDLYLAIYDSNAKQIDEIVLDVGKIPEKSWYHTYVNANLQKGRIYTLKISAKNCDTIPCLQMVDSNYLSSENVSGNVMIGYAYAASTFTFQNKILMFIFVVAIWCIICSEFLLTGKGKERCEYIALFLVITAILSWNYMYNSMDSHNTSFDDFQADSEALVIWSVSAMRHGVGFASEDDTGYGLGLYNAKGQFEAYRSQYGLHGKVFGHLAMNMSDEEYITNLRLICSIATASVFVAIVFLLFKKYNLLMAGCFVVTFWLSPWVVNFARNLYWVEFTWFLPMAVGLFCAWKVENRKCRILSYCATFVFIMVKCLCGYEYLSSVMMGVIVFLLVDLAKAIIKRDKEKGILLFRTTIIIGIAALAGFGAAICIHADLRGAGDVFEGIKTIFERDVLRRTMGGDLNEFRDTYWSSFNASIWETLCKYFKFPRADQYEIVLPSEIIAGMNGNLFPALCIIPLCIFVFDYKKKVINIENTAMYLVFFLTSISWFCLAKSHSYAHLHMNYVLWYFGYVQVCFYIIIDKITKVFQFQKDALE